MQNENTKRAWLYARIPGNDVETLRCIRECAAKAQQDNCKIVGTSADERYGWLLRPGYREMMRQVKAGEIDCIYIYRMRQISGKEQHLFRFFQQVMQHGIKVVTQEYSLRDRLHEYRLGIKLKTMQRGINCPFHGKLRKMSQTMTEKCGKMSQEGMNYD